MKTMIFLYLIIRALNAKQFAGDGEDILLQNNLPIDSYVEQGDLYGIGEADSDNSELYSGISEADEQGFTIVSWIRSLCMVPNVNSVSPIKSRLNYEVSGTGTIDYTEISFLPICEGLKVEQVFCQIGEWVEEGQDLIKYEKDSVEEAIIRTEIEKLECQSAAAGMESEYRVLMDDKIMLLERRMDILKEILENDCMQTSDTTGYIGEMQVQARTVTNGNEIVGIVFGTPYIKGTVETGYDSLINDGDAIEVRMGNDAIMGEVIKCDYDSKSKELMLAIALSQGQYGYGTEGYYSFRIQSETYDLCIPNTALFQDEKGAYYVLAVEERNSILGNHLVTVRKEVDLLAQDNDYSAVQGEITKNDKVIYSWDNEVYEDLPVRENK